jgi:hypothetical protein
LHKTQIALFFKGAWVFFLPHDQLLTHFFSGLIIFALFYSGSKTENSIRNSIGLTADITVL